MDVENEKVPLMAIDLYSVVEVEGRRGVVTDISDLGYLIVFREGEAKLFSDTEPVSMVKSPLELALESLGMEEVPPKA